MYDKTRILPPGTPVALKEPYQGRTLARVEEHLGRSRYGLRFEGRGQESFVADFTRREFNLARAGT